MHDLVVEGVDGEKEGEEGEDCPDAYVAAEVKPVGGAEGAGERFEMVGEGWEEILHYCNGVGRVGDGGGCFVWRQKGGQGGDMWDCSL